jgi:hypothetical protein
LPLHGHQQKAPAEGGEAIGNERCGERHDRGATVVPADPVRHPVGLLYRGEVWIGLHAMLADIKTFNFLGLGHADAAREGSDDLPDH